MRDLNHKSGNHERIMRSVETDFCMSRKTVLGKCLNSWSCQFSIWKFKWQKILGGGWEVVVNWMGIYIFIFTCIYIYIYIFIYTHTFTISTKCDSTLTQCHRKCISPVPQLLLALFESSPLLPSRQSFEAV